MKSLYLYSDSSKTEQCDVISTNHSSHLDHIKYQLKMSFQKKTRIFQHSHYVIIELMK